MSSHNSKQGSSSLSQLYLAVQPEIMRDDDLEEKAYKRHLRKAHKEKEKNLRKMMGTQNEK